MCVVREKRGARFVSEESSESRGDVYAEDVERVRPRLRTRRGRTKTARSPDAEGPPGSARGGERLGQRDGRSESWLGQGRRADVIADAPPKQVAEIAAAAAQLWEKRGGTPGPGHTHAHAAAARSRGRVCRRPRLPAAPSSHDRRPPPRHLFKVRARRGALRRLAEASRREILTTSFRPSCHAVTVRRRR